MSRKTVVNLRMLSRRSSSGTLAAARARGPTTPPSSEQTKIVNTKTSEERRLAARSNLHPLKREQSAYYTREKEGFGLFYYQLRLPVGLKMERLFCLGCRPAKPESAKVPKSLPGPNAPRSQRMRVVRAPTAPAAPTRHSKRRRTFGYSIQMPCIQFARDRAIGRLTVRPLGDDPLGSVCQLMRLRQELDGGLNVWVCLDVILVALTEVIAGNVNFARQIPADKVQVFRELGFGEFKFLLIEKLAKLIEGCLVGLPLGRQLVVGAEVMLGVVEESRAPDQLVLESIIPLRGQPDVRSDPVAPVHGPAAVSHLDLELRRIHVTILPARIGIVLVQRNVVVRALDQPAAGRVVMGGGQRQSRIVAEGIH